MTDKSDIANRLAECFNVLKTDYIQNAAALAESIGVLYLHDKERAISLWESLLKEHYAEIVEHEILDTGELSTDVLHQIKMCADIKSAAEALEKSDFLRQAIMGKMKDVSIFILIEIISCYILDGKTPLVKECLSLMLESKPLDDDEDDGLTWFEILLDRIQNSGCFEFGDDCILRRIDRYPLRMSDKKAYTEMLNVLTAVLDKMESTVARARAEVKILHMQFYRGV
ncbi:MAG: hypothetical protein IKT36_01775 [Methanocorpusculum sp.]|jgi:hypothetical protein|nr:hypothetical protein [Methanocorpusculum sp.]HJJ60996.1 hypothetical protein [Methanocorpusculum sp.]